MSIVRPLALALGFLTRLPVPGDTREAEDVGASLPFFPVVGAMLGVILCSAAWAAAAWFPAPLTAVGVVALLAALTGGLHVDGLADVFDGISGSHGDRARALAIMRDSRVGAHGALALLLVVLAKVIGVTAALQQQALWVIVAFPAVARWAIVPLIVCLPYVRQAGLGWSFKAHALPRHVLWATVLVAVLVLWCGAAALAPAAGTLVAALLFGHWMRRRLGGMTGDAYGAAIELGEVVFLAVACRGT
jgi:adenosylcobinamide-GDP ribazoletransferase